MREGGIWVVGAGGIGCAIGGRLAASRPGDVTFVDGWPAHVEAIRRDGLRVEYPDTTLTLPVAATSIDALPAGEPDLILLAVKSYDTEAVVRELARVTSRAPIVSVQNSMNEGLIASFVGEARTVAAVVHFDGQVVEPGRARQQFTSTRLIVGSWGPQGAARLPEVVRILRDARPTVIEVSDTIVGELWDKIVINSMMSAPTTLFDLSLGDFVADPRRAEISVAVARETMRVARAAGVTLVAPTLFGCPVGDYAGERGSPAWQRAVSAVVAEFAGRTELFTSMSADARKRRPTEIALINGYIAARARDAGVPAPLNEQFTVWITDVDRTGTRPDPDAALHTALGLIG